MTSLLTRERLLTVRAIFFDAVGTLLRSDPPVHEVYARFARCYGLHPKETELCQRFRAAFARQRLRDRQHNWRTDEARERQRWCEIVREVFPELADTEPLFSALWHHFARADAWGCYPEVADVLERLAARGYLLGIASNFDSRLRQIYRNLPCLRQCSWLVISSEIGWVKPARTFFDTVAQTVGLPPSEILYVGDDYETDCLPAMEAGFHAAWLHRHPYGSAVVPATTASDKAKPGQAAFGASGNLPEDKPARSAMPGQNTIPSSPYLLASLEELLTLLPPSASRSA